MITTLLLATAAALPLGVWPDASGGPTVVQDGIEIYQVEPEDDFWVLAVQPLAPPLSNTDRDALAPLVAVADKLGADAVLLLGEMAVGDVPEDLQTPLVGSGRWSAAAFLLFDCDCEEPAPRIFRGRLHGVRPVTPEQVAGVR